MKITAFLLSAKILLIYTLALLPYSLYFWYISFMDLDSLIYLGLHLLIFLSILFVYKILKPLIHRNKTGFDVNAPFSNIDIGFILLLWLLIVSATINPIAFAYFLAPLESNLLLHLLIISLIINRFQAKLLSLLFGSVIALPQSPQCPPPTTPKSPG